MLLLLGWFLFTGLLTVLLRESHIVPHYSLRTLIASSRLDEILLNNSTGWVESTVDKEDTNASPRDWTEDTYEQKGLQSFQNKVTVPAGFTDWRECGYEESTEKGESDGLYTYDEKDMLPVGNESLFDANYYIVTTRVESSVELAANKIGSNSNVSYRADDMLPSHTDGPYWIENVLVANATGMQTNARSFELKENNTDMPYLKRNVVRIVGGPPPVQSKLCSNVSQRDAVHASLVAEVFWIISTLILFQILNNV